MLSQGETETQEFKEYFDKEAIETAGAFANTNGGIILVGVGDRGEVLGAPTGDQLLKEWANRVSQLSEPTLIPSVGSVTMDEKSVAVIVIREFPLKPVAIRGRCYRRVGASNRVMTPTEISQMHFQVIGTTWDALSHPDYYWDDIQEKEFSVYLLKAKELGRREMQGNMDHQTLARKLGLLEGDVPRWATVIAFGKQPPLQAKVKCGRIKGTSTILDDFVVDAPLLKQVGMVMNYLKRMFTLSYVLTGEAQREELWEYPLEAVREAVTNAICHRDYSSPAQTQIKIFDDRLVIWNPGGLPFGMTQSKLMDPTHGSVPRNKLIAMLFYDTGLIENYGSGVQRILEECSRLGFPEPEFRDEEGGFQVVFFKDRYSEEELGHLDLSERQITGLLLAKENGRITNKEYRKLTQISDRTALSDLKELCEKGLLVREGKTGRETVYLLNYNQTRNKPEINPKNPK